MNAFEKLVQIMQYRRISYQRLSEMVPMGKDGLHKAIKNKTLSVEMLQHICTALGRFDAATAGTSYHQGNGLQFAAITDLCEILNTCAAQLAAAFAARTIYHSRHTCLAHQRRVQELHGYILGL